MLAALFAPIEALVGGLRQLIKGIAEFLVARLDTVATILPPQRGRALDALGGSPGLWRGWRVIGSFIYVLMLLAFTTAEAGIMALVLEAWGFGEATSFIADNANFFVNVTLLASLAFWGLVLLDMSGTTALAPWGELKEPWWTLLKRFTFTAIGLALVALFMVGVWRGIRTTEGSLLLRDEIDAAAPVIALAVLSVIVGAAALLSGWSLYSFPAAMFAIVLALVEWVSRLMRAALQLIAMATEPLEHVILALIAVPATLGATVWNWFVRVAGRWIGFNQIPMPRAVMPVVVAPASATELVKSPATNGSAVRRNGDVVAAERGKARLRVAPPGQRPSGR